MPTTTPRRWSSPEGQSSTRCSTPSRPRTPGGADGLGPFDVLWKHPAHLAARELIGLPLAGHQPLLCEHVQAWRPEYLAAIGCRWIAGYFPMGPAAGGVRPRVAAGDSHGVGESIDAEGPPRCFRLETRDRAVRRPRSAEAQPLPVPSRPGVPRLQKRASATWYPCNRRVERAVQGTRRRLPA